MVLMGIIKLMENAHDVMEHFHDPALDPPLSHPRVWIPRPRGHGCLSPIKHLHDPALDPPLPRTQGLDLPSPRSWLPL